MDRRQEEDEDQDDGEDGRNNVHYYLVYWDSSGLGRQAGLEVEHAPHAS